MQRLLFLWSAVVFAQGPDWNQVNRETLEHFQALVRLDTQNPPGNETRAVDYLRQVLEAAGIPTKTFSLEPERANLVARLKGDGFGAAAAGDGAYRHCESGPVQVDAPAVQRASGRRIYLRSRHGGRQRQCGDGPRDSADAQSG
jgi:hypothetical protein